MNPEIKEYISKLEVIDTHEHLPPFESLREEGDVFRDFLLHYFNVDLVSSGMSVETLELLRGDSLGATEKWRILEPYWEKCRYTGYGQGLSLSACGIYGVEDISADTIEELNAAFMSCKKPGHYHKVLREKCNIKISILDRWGETTQCDPDFFIMANSLNALVYPETEDAIPSLGQHTGVEILSFDDYLKAIEIRMGQYLQGSRLLKCGVAYSRSLDFARTEKNDAERGFKETIKTGKCDVAFSNYIFRYIVELAQESNMVMQIHTGLQEGNGNLLSNSRPILLNQIFLDYPRMMFDVFHIGYPYQGEVGILCKMFPNVYVDFCWTFLASPVAARRALSDWLEFLPYNKLLGYGGDYCFIDAIYGHQHMARNNIAEVLSEKVEQGLFGVEKACEIGKALLYDNPAELFGIS